MTIIRYYKESCAWKKRELEEGKKLKEKALFPRVKHDNLLEGDRRGRYEIYLH